MEICARRNAIQEKGPKFCSICAVILKGICLTNREQAFQWKDATDTDILSQWQL